MGHEFCIDLKKIVSFHTFENFSAKVSSFVVVASCFFHPPPV